MADSSRTLYQAISIHALREEGDTVTLRAITTLWNFYPRPPRGGRLSIKCFRSDKKLFLSTPSARRATLFTTTKASLITISIHALREEGD